MDRTGQEPVVSATAASRAGEPAGDPRPAGAAPADSGLVARGDFAALSRPHLSPILGRYYERSWDHGEGHTLYDSAGRGFLDFACGIATTSLGHHHPAVTQAIKDQADKLLHICNALGYLEPVGQLATMLATRARTRSTPSSSETPAPRPSRVRSSSLGASPAGPASSPFGEPSTAEPSAPHRSRARASTTGSATSRCCRRST